MIHRKLFFAFLGWAALCCFMSPWPALAVYGCHLRYEGLLTYALCALFAWEYWRNFETVKAITLPLLILTASYPFFTHWIGLELCGWLIVPPVAIGAMCAVGFGIAYPLSRWVAVPILVCGLWTGSRAFLVSAVLVVLIVEGLKFERKAAFKWCLAVLAISIAVIPFTPLKAKILNTRVDFEGSRSQWIKQAISLSRSLPLTGYGLDTGTEWLKPAHGRTAEAKDVIADRTHNLFTDVLIWTGWTGLFLFVALLFSTGKAVIDHFDNENLACGLGCLAFVTFGLMNPLGCVALVLFFTCILGVRK